MTDRNEPTTPIRELSLDACRQATGGGNHKEWINIGTDWGTHRPGGSGGSSSSKGGGGLSPTEMWAYELSDA